MNFPPISRIIVSTLFLAAALTYSVTPIWNQTASANGSASVKYTFTYAYANNQTPAPEDLREFAREVISKLARTEMFQSWGDADEPVIEPLGPGTHSWLITIPLIESNPAGTDSTGPGYMIITAAGPGEYKLVEYGFGADSIFSSRTLGDALNEYGLNSPDQKSNKLNVAPVYGGPVLAGWRVSGVSGGKETVFLDALNGEQLPENDRTWNKQEKQYKAPVTAAGSRERLLIPDQPVLTSTEFDPYDNIKWMTEQALDVAPNTLTKLLTRNKELVFVTSGPSRTYQIPLPVYGFQMWNVQSASSANDRQLSKLSPSSSTYVLTGTETSPRLIAVEALTEAGKFVNYTEGTH